MPMRRWSRCPRFSLTSTCRGDVEEKDTSDIMRTQRLLSHLQTLRSPHDQGGETGIFDLKPFLARTGTGRTIAAFRRKDMLFSQGEPADAVFYLLKGTVKLTVVSQQGKEAVIAMLGPDHFLGEGVLAGQRVRMATATATSEGSALKFERMTIVRLLRDQPTFSELVFNLSACPQRSH